MKKHNYPILPRQNPHPLFWSGERQDSYKKYRLLPNSGEEKAAPAAHGCDWVRCNQEIFRLSPEKERIVTWAEAFDRSRRRAIIIFPRDGDGRRPHELMEPGREGTAREERLRGAKRGGGRTSRRKTCPILSMESPSSPLRPCSTAHSRHGNSDDDGGGRGGWKIGKIVRWNSRTLGIWTEEGKDDEKLYSYLGCLRVFTKIID